MKVLGHDFVDNIVIFAILNQKLLCVSKGLRPHEKENHS
jgi:hypothetical protein